MIKPQEALFANLTEQLQKDLPQEPLTRLVNLSAISVGVLRSKSIQVGQIVTASPLSATRDTIKKRIQRFLKNDGVDVDTYQKPIAQRILNRLVAGGARVLLIIDRTEWGEFNVLYVSVGWRGRAIPLTWRMIGRGPSSFDEQRELLSVVASWLPEAARVMLLGDREFGTGVLAQWALGKGWGVCLRIKAHEYVLRDGQTEFEMVPCLRSGQRLFWPNVRFTQKHAADRLNLAMSWEKGAEEPWYLITTEPTVGRACSSYGKRFQIEEMFKDHKNDGRGLGLELTGLRDPERLARLLVAVALVYTWLLLWGAYVVKAGYRRFVDNVKRPTLSLFQTGLRYVNRLRDRGMLVRWQWHLSVLSPS